MIRLYFQQALYHLRENPIITWVSIAGTALAICMIMVLVITLQVRMVDCEPEVNRSRSLYVSYITYKQKGADDSRGAHSSMSVRTGRECLKPLASAQAVTLVSQSDKVRLSVPAGAQTTADMVATDADFWTVFRFRFLDGKPFTQADCDAGLPRAVIAASVARKLFGTTEASGRTMMMNHAEFQVTGVVADVSTLASDCYAQVWTTYNAVDTDAYAWGPAGVMGVVKAIVLARDRADFPQLRREAALLLDRYNDGLDDYEISFKGQPDGRFVHLYRRWYTLRPDTGGAVLRYVAVILILLLVPAINLSSMTLSRMRKRMAEIGVRKAFGATGNELMGQVFMENMLLTLIAGVLGFLLSYAATFVLNGFLFGDSANAVLSGDTTLTPGMLLSPWTFAAALLFCLLMNLLSAGIPAWKASRMNIVDAINQR